MFDAESMFGPFGAAVVVEIQRQVARDGDLSTVLRHLGQPVPRVLEDQASALRNHLYQQGVLSFLNAMGAMELTNPRSSSGSTGGGKAANAAAGVYRRPGDGSSTGGGGMAASQRAGGSVTGPRQSTNVSEFLAAAAREPHGSVVTPVHDQTTSPASDGPYAGPDRRVSAPDRRAGVQDRRGGLQVVFKNRRFGGWDRRKMLRREADRKRIGRV